MKCRHCGYTIDHGIVCPLCGKKNIGPEHCAVCDAIIYPGQEYCNHCGTPSSHRKMPTLDVSKGAFDLNKQSQTNHSYTFQEGYNYKDNAYDFKEKAKQRIDKRWQKNTFNLNIKPQKVLIGVFIISLFVVSILFSALTDRNHVADARVEMGNTPITTLHVNGETNNLAKQANAWQTAYSFMDGDTIYLAGDFVWKTNREFSEAVLFEEYVCGGMYIKDPYWYYVDFGNELCRYHSETGEVEELAHRIEASYMVDSRIYYVNDNHDLYYYDVDTDEKSDVIVNKVMSFYVDEKQESIYYISLLGHLVQYDVENSQSREYKNIQGDNFIVDGNTLYIYDGINNIYCYDLQTEEVVDSIQCGSIRYFAYYNGMYVYLDFTGTVYKVTTDSQAIQISSPDLFVNAFQIQGDRLFMRTLQNDSVWYVCDFDGNFAIVSEEME